MSKRSKKSNRRREGARVKKQIRQIIAKGAQ